MTTRIAGAPWNFPALSERDNGTEKPYNKKERGYLPAPLRLL